MENNRFALLSKSRRTLDLMVFSDDGAKEKFSKILRDDDIVLGFIGFIDSKNPSEIIYDFSKTYLGGHITEGIPLPLNSKEEKRKPYTIIGYGENMEQVITQAFVNYFSPKKDKGCCNGHDSFGDMP